MLPNTDGRGREWNGRRRATVGRAILERSRRFIAGADASATAEQKVAELQAQINAYRDLSTALAYGDA